ncbi:23S rRNA (cytidine1920-2'-O)/16S rRNA (cytidine1409-2'-O)-methyltransferase [Paraoerskovia marina]|uniref:23S rRNA (Cytidine1920-2'-O)/16S rRNA (Cytidine1409-2'-O)-methyltransferase n=1 Tax=Paraoerskovia marina TaxID=545619 RepID=A0A1H1TJ30_9CELL|nr:TlyA family RNA methyltransferase [Paraoerskovia marina]SDS59966.1 23S rRNA (cytidine1920-2'-O)/16S rRNA (cytidine1409-2'-O)-methyltransferase [Paraoerskovia marina]
MLNRLDVELALRGLVRSRERASRLVKAGSVTVDGVVATRPSARISPSAALVVDDAEFVSRAGAKLAGAVDAFAASGAPVSVERARCVDLGASTGGFTDVLLRQGAEQVTAVDVGHGQLVDELRDDPRVVNLEGLNVRDLEPQAFGEIDVLVGDLSFISLRLVLPVVASLVSEKTDIVLLVKPQFEIGRDRLGATGVVKSLEQRAECVTAVAEAAAHAGLSSVGLVPSSLPGPNGNREFVLRLRAGEPPASVVPADIVRSAVRWETDHDEIATFPTWIAHRTTWTEEP